ncbi:MAG: type II secretion system protein [Phycisphaeraceae bacterium]
MNPLNNTNHKNQTECDTSPGRKPGGNPSSSTPRHHKANAGGAWGGFTTIELLVVISIIALLVAILLPTLGAVRNLVRQTEAQSQARGIQTGLTLFAQDNNAWFPGLSNQGRATPSEFNDGGYRGATAELDATELASELSSSNINDVETWWADAITWTLLNKGHVTPDQLISPAEPDKAQWDAGYEDSDLTDYLALHTETQGPAHSYAYLDPRNGDQHPINPGHGPTNRVRIAAWRDSANSQIPVVSDRMLLADGSDFRELDPTAAADYTDANDTATPATGFSVHQLNTGNRESASWQGVVVMNDGSASFRDRILPATQLSQTFAVKQNANRTGDDIFFPTSQTESNTEINDAVMLYADTQ